MNAPGKAVKATAATATAARYLKRRPEKPLSHRRRAASDKRLQPLTQADEETTGCLQKRLTDTATLTSLQSQVASNFSRACP